jgi:hypothetical protein
MPGEGQQRRAGETCNPRRIWDNQSSSTDSTVEDNAVIELTEEQCLALPTGTEPVRAIDSVTKTEYVLLRADVFDRLRALLYDDSPWTDEERDLLRAEAVDALGWEGMEVYQDEEA